MPFTPQLNLFLFLVPFIFLNKFPLLFISIFVLANFILFKSGFLITDYNQTPNFAYFPLFLFETL